MTHLLIVRTTLFRLGCFGSDCLKVFGFCFEDISDEILLGEEAQKGRDYVWGIECDCAVNLLSSHRFIIFAFSLRAAVELFETTAFESPGSVRECPT